MKATEISKTENTIMDDQRVLSAGIVDKIADEYEEQDRIEKAYREDLENKVKELDQMILNSQNRMRYKLLYKPEYGDYRDFVEKVAEELRRRDASR